jgi:hypothetical protein
VADELERLLGSPRSSAGIAATGGTSPHRRATHGSIARAFVGRVSDRASSAAAGSPREKPARESSGVGRHAQAVEHRRHSALPRRRLDGSGRGSCLVFAAPLRAALKNGGEELDGSFEPHAPDHIWPEDRAWFIATDVDLESGYIGGSRRLIETSSATTVSSRPCSPRGTRSSWTTRLGWHPGEPPTRPVQVLPDEFECAVATEVDNNWKPALAGVAGEPGGKGRHRQFDRYRGSSMSRSAAAACVRCARTSRCPRASEIWPSSG